MKFLENGTRPQPPTSRWLLPLQQKAVWYLWDLFAHIECPCCGIFFSRSLVVGYLLKTDLHTTLGKKKIAQHKDTRFESCQRQVVLKSMSSRERTHSNIFLEYSWSWNTMNTCVYAFIFHYCDCDWLWTTQNSRFRSCERQSRSNLRVRLREHILVYFVSTRFTLFERTAILKSMSSCEFVRESNLLWVY